MKRDSSDKTRFCVSHDGLTNGLETFCFQRFVFKYKTKNFFLNRRGSNILEPGLQYNGASAPIYWSPSNIYLPKQTCLSEFEFIQLRKGYIMSHKMTFQSFKMFRLSPIYWSPSPPHSRKLKLN